MNSPLHLAQWRLLNQRLTGTPCAGPGETVRWLGAVQAQDYLAALWAIGLRSQGLTESTVERAIADREIVRLWFMRGTLHFLPAADLRWMVQFMAPRMRRLLDNTSRANRLELTGEVFARTDAIIARALEGGKRLTRAELSAALEQGGVPASGLRFSLILQGAQANGLICYATRRGKQHTLALLDEWLPSAPNVQTEEALVEFARRYFRSHGPATLQDFAWWSGLSLTEARPALDLLQRELDHESLGGQTYWFAGEPSATVDDPAFPAFHLLPNYDEYTVGYRERSAAVDADRTPGLDPRSAIMLGHTVLSGGKVLGSWKRDIGKSEVVVRINPLTALTVAESTGLASAVQRYGEFLGARAALAD